MTSDLSEPISTAPAPTEDEHASAWEDIIDVLYAPARVFARRRESGFGAQLFLVTILLVATFFVGKPVTMPVLETQVMAQQQAAFAKNKNMTAETREKALQMTRDKLPLFTALGVVLGTPIILLVLGFFIWLFAKFFDAKFPYASGVLIGTLAYVPRCIGAIVATAIGYLRGTDDLTNMAQLSAGPGLLLTGEVNPIAAVVASRLDLTVIWATVIIGIGIAVLGKVSRGKGMAAAFTIWLAAGLWAALSAMRAM